MPTSVEIVADSVSPEGIRLTTYKLRYPRIIHAEFMTHRVFSRNASSSRAIPTSKMVSWLEEDRYVPQFRKNKPGMQPGHPLSPGEQAMAEEVWIGASRKCIEASQVLAQLGVHKQWSNRLLEWFGYINVLVSSTQWSNFFKLREDIDKETGFPVAQDEIFELTQMMKKAMKESYPQHLDRDEWHLPFIDTRNVLWDDEVSVSNAIKCSVARCARVSYTTTEGKSPTIEEDLKLYDRLLNSSPRHCSPAEHQATPDTARYFADRIFWAAPHLHGNFSGWVQFRKTIPGECL